MEYLEIKKYIPLVKMIARKIHCKLPPFVELEDLIGAGTLGLVQAIKRFDPSKSNDPQKYIGIRIRGAILDELRAMDLFSRGTRKRIKEVENAMIELKKNLGNKISEKEVAKKLGLNLTKYAKLMKKLYPIMVIKFDDLKIFNNDEKKDILQYIKDPSSVDPSRVFIYKKIMESVADCIKKLSQNERVVITLYYYEELNLREIGKIMSLTESRICQIHSSAILSIKNCLLKKEVDKMDFSA